MRPNLVYTAALRRNNFDLLYKSRKRGEGLMTSESWRLERSTLCHQIPHFLFRNSTPCFFAATISQHNKMASGKLWTTSQARYRHSVGVVQWERPILGVIAKKEVGTPKPIFWRKWCAAAFPAKATD